MSPWHGLRDVTHADVTACAPQTFLAPLGALSLVWNIILAPKFHGERVTRRNLWATVIIFVGVTSTVIFSTHVTPKYRLDDILYLFTQAVFIVYAVSIGLALTGLYMLAKYIEKHDVPWSLTHCVCYGGLAGIFGGQSVMLAKSVVEPVKSALFEGGDAFSHFPTYLLVAGMAVRVGPFVCTDCTLTDVALHCHSSRCCHKSRS